MRDDEAVECRIRYGATILLCSIVVLVAFCAAGGAEGQTLTGSVAWYAVPIGTDQITTEMALNRGGFETNKTLQGPLSKRVAMATAETYALALERRHTVSHRQA